MRLFYAVVLTLFFHCTSNATVRKVTVSGPLPVKFGAFTIINNNNKALLQWQTFSESKTSYFSIRGSTDNSHLHICDLEKGTYNVVFSLNGKKEIRRWCCLKSF